MQETRLLARRKGIERLEPKSASIELLHRDQGLSIFNIVWPPLTVLVPHDHLMWAAIGVYTGREDNIMWEP